MHFLHFGFHSQVSINDIRMWHTYLILGVAVVVCVVDVVFAVFLCVLGMWASVCVFESVCFVVSYPFGVFAPYNLHLVWCTQTHKSHSCLLFRFTAVLCAGFCLLNIFLFLFYLRFSGGFFEGRVSSWLKFVAFVSVLFELHAHRRART